MPNMYETMFHKPIARIHCETIHFGIFLLFMIVHIIEMVAIKVEARGTCLRYLSSIECIQF